MPVHLDSVSRHCTIHVLFCYSAFPVLLGQKFNDFLHKSAEGKNEKSIFFFLCKLVHFLNVALSKNKKHYKENKFG